MKPRHANLLLRALVLLLTSMLLWGSQANAAVACKNSGQKNDKACSHTVQKKKPSPKQQTLAKNAVSCPGTKNPLARRRCLAAVAAAHRAGARPAAVAPGVVPVPAAAASPTPAATATGPTTPCFAALAASQAAQHMAAKVPFLAGQVPGPATLAMTEHPSKKEQAELSSLIAGYQMCHDMGTPASTSDEAGAQSHGVDDHWRTTKSILDELHAGKLSYGAAARALAEVGHDNPLSN